MCVTFIINMEENIFLDLYFQQPYFGMYAIVSLKAREIAIVYFLNLI